MQSSSVVQGAPYFVIRLVSPPVVPVLEEPVDIASVSGPAVVGAVVLPSAASVVPGVWVVLEVWVPSLVGFEAVTLLGSLEESESAVGSAVFEAWVVAMLPSPLQARSSEQTRVVQARVRMRVTIGAVERARAAFLRWREVPAPRRGEVLRRFGLLLRQHKTGLGRGSMRSLMVFLT